MVNAKNARKSCPVFIKIMQLHFNLSILHVNCESFIVLQLIIILSQVVVFSNYLNSS